MGKEYKQKGPKIFGYLVIHCSISSLTHDKKCKLHYTGHGRQHSMMTPMIPASYTDTLVWAELSDLLLAKRSKVALL